MIVSRDEEMWVLFEVEDPRRRTQMEQKTIALPLNLYLLAVSEAKSFAALRAKMFELAGEFARSNAAKARMAARAATTSK